MDTLNIYYDKIGSTNSEAKNILLKHNIKKAVIIADEQTSGKGRYGNKWISKKGNLYMSLVFQVKSYNCLLYTSPSPRDDELSRMPSSA